MINAKGASRLLLAVLEGTVFANAIRRNGQPCRICLPDDPDARAALVTSHLRGGPATLTFVARGRKQWRERVDAVVLAMFCPASDGRCPWVAIDLDAADHGECGLADPVHAVRAIAERAANAGLLSGLLVARSRGGQGRHVFLLLPEPVPLADAVLGIAALTAAAFRVSKRDVAHYDGPHAFRRADGTIACPGDAGAVELYPRSTAKPPYGWALALPGAGAFAARGGGIIVNPFSDEPSHHDCVPRCDQRAWSRFVDEARTALSARTVEASRHGRRPPADQTLPRDPFERIDARTREFIEGHVAEGARNVAAFAASANLLGCGVEPSEAEQMIVAGASACGLAQREARSAFKSAERAMRQRKVCK